MRRKMGIMQEDAHESRPLINAILVERLAKPYILVSFLPIVRSQIILEIIF